MSWRAPPQKKLVASHPKTEILNRYSSQGIQLFRTDFHGSVRFDFNSEGEVKCESVMGECGTARCL